uniref:Uncharacterized protein n=1 Tax=Trichobilharzia regenti TaxID=157069 RepID=A0AA85JM26_TRIRE|nr:unnamed protein product [Trichobilharzia regenti]
MGQVHGNCFQSGKQHIRSPRNVVLYKSSEEEANRNVLTTVKSRCGYIGTSQPLTRRRNSEWHPDGWGGSTQNYLTDGGICSWIIPIQALMKTKHVDQRRVSFRRIHFLSCTIANIYALFCMYVYIKFVKQSYNWLRLLLTKQVKVGNTGQEN